MARNDLHSCRRYVLRARWWQRALRELAAAAADARRSRRCPARHRAATKLRQRGQAAPWRFGQSRALKPLRVDDVHRLASRRLPNPTLRPAPGAPEPTIRVRTWTLGSAP